MAFVVADRVRDTTLTNGTGVLTVDAAPPDTYRTFSAVCATNDTLQIVIVHRTANEWEVCNATYSASNQLTRNRVLASSNAGAAVSFTSGVKDVAMVVAALNAFGREELHANRTYFVRADSTGDSNTGLVDSAGGAFLTLQKAIDTIWGQLDLGIYDVTIDMGNGTTYAGAVVDGPLMGSGAVTVSGDTTTPANITFTSSIFVGNNAKIYFQGCKFTSSGFGIHVSSGAYCELLGKCEFGANTSAGIGVEGTGSAFRSAVISHTVSGGGFWFIEVAGGAHCQYAGGTTTITGTPAFGVSFVAAYGNAILAIDGVTWSGSATGKRFEVTDGAVLDTGGQADTWLPGNAAGAGLNYTASPWGLYV